MCGIIGIVGGTEVVPMVVEGLRRLEYRGYDSSGVATVHTSRIERARAEGKLKNLEIVLEKAPLHGSVAIGHTRWATHGVPNEKNAHPHATAEVAVVHNGIIENFQELSKELRSEGFAFASDTDTEVVPLLITHYLRQKLAPADAVAQALKRLKGAFALGIVFADEPDLLIGARSGPPLAIGFGKGQMFLGSDALALSHLTDRISYLEDGDWVELRHNAATIHDADDRPVERPRVAVNMSGASIGKGNYRHFMQKEIFEQPETAAETLKSVYNPAQERIRLPAMPFALEKVTRINLIACGTSHYASLIAGYWMEEIAGVAVRAEIASEFRYRAPVLCKDELAVFISQSGETADTLATLRYAKQAGLPTLAIVNVPGSSLAREADAVLHTLAGPEIGVASTKAFTTQLMALACLTLGVAEAKKSQDAATLRQLSDTLVTAPAKMSEILHLDDRIAALAHNLVHAKSMLYIGRGTGYALALEGALKLKEISYIHAEAYAAGELKHGPIALIDEQMPVIVIAPSDRLFEKLASNVQEAAARGGRIILISDRNGCNALGDLAVATILMPDTHPLIAPMLYALPVQMLAYHVAVMKGTDVDQPRNLAKSVTVE